MSGLPNIAHDPVPGSRPGPEIDPDLHDVAQRVHEEFDDRLDPLIVDECLNQVVARFASAPVRNFVPLLVRRYVREELQARQAQIKAMPPSPPHMPTAGVAGSSTPW
jgi:hypothetical protein